MWLGLLDLLSTIFTTSDWRSLVCAPEETLVATPTTPSNTGCTHQGTFLATLVQRAAHFLTKFGFVNSVVVGAPHECSTISQLTAV
jgi:hypothetical protein